MKLFLCCCFLQCAALVGEDQPLCPDLPELDLSELDVNDLDADSFLGGLKWYSDQSEIISNQYSNEPANIFEVRQGNANARCQVLDCFFSYFFFILVDNSFTIFPLFRDSKRGDVCYGFWLAPLILMIKTRPAIWRRGGKALKGIKWNFWFLKGNG